MKNKRLLLFISLILFLGPVTVSYADWSSMTSGTTNGLSGIWGSSSSDVFAVGGNGTILHYDGSAWSAMTSGNTNNLYGVWGSSSNNVFAVGASGKILHYNGSTWTAMTSGTTYPLHGVWGSSGTDVFAVGGFIEFNPDYGPSYDGIILHYNGSAWSTMASGTAYPLYGVWGSSANDIFAVGGYTYSELYCICPSCSMQCLGSRVVKLQGIKHFNGVNWSETTSSGTTLCGVWGSSGSDVFAVSGYVYYDEKINRTYSGGDIHYYDGSTWSSMSESTSYPLTGVWGSSGTDVFVAGAGGNILRYNGSAWSAMTSGTTSDLNGVWGSSGNDVFAVGNAGTILHYDGTVTTTTVPPTTTTTTTPTLIELSSFTATPQSGKVILQWTTESEIDNAGFNLYRSETEDGNYVKINTSLIPAQGSSTQGASYEYVDSDVKNRKTYFYKLEDIDQKGTSTFHGPVSATPRLLYGLSNK